MSAHKVDPWKYVPIGSDPSTTLLYKKKYAEIRARDFYNVDVSVIPYSVEPSKLYLYRYLRYEPYFYEMFDLNSDMHPFHPLHPTTEEIQKITNKFYFTTRNPMSFPLKTKKSGDKRETKRSLRNRSDEDMDVEGALFAAGLSETTTHLSPDDLQSSWQSSDAETGSTGTLYSWRYGERVRVKMDSEIKRDPNFLEGTENVRQLWKHVQGRPRVKTHIAEELASLCTMLEEDELEDLCSALTLQQEANVGTKPFARGRSKTSEEEEEDASVKSSGSQKSRVSQPSATSEKDE